MYPYAAAGTGLTAMLPPWADADGKLYDNLPTPPMRATIRAEALAPPATGRPWRTTLSAPTA